MTMTAGIAHGIWTLILVITFIAIVIWTFSKAKKAEFEQAAWMPLEDDTSDTLDSTHG
jgi:cytochrome c oxidase cbb3-type subunit IV